MKPFLDGCTALGFNPNDEQLNKFEKYLSMLLEWNEKFNLTAITDPKEIMVQHFLDSISILKLEHIAEGSTVLDLGSGAGFPGIPVKIMMPGISLTLVDSVNKKVGFLKEVIKHLDLKSTESVHARAEDLAREERRREAYDTVVSRAVAELRVLAEYCLPFVKKGGYFMAHKGPGAMEEVDQAEKALRVLGGELIQVKQIDIPFSEKTHMIIVVRKVNKTPVQYPRSAGKPKKSPL
ncbi:MAG TPA: 16S rRNA (guanine(527)-N(7))-methyltransferase RsmG [Clostridiales bacterium]|nr:16S rRNA (guanine(527)-N(7))-methyltransferase RsmG [Clostridiales bacterium]